MSPGSLSAEILAYPTCPVCYKSESRTVKFKKCGACKKPAYCSKECQRKDWPSHKRTCQLQSENRESLPARGTEVRDTLSDIKKWFSKHTQLLVHTAVQAMKLHDPANVSMTRTHMLVVELEPAPSGKHADFVYRYAALRETKDPQYDLKEALCAALAADAEVKDRHRLTMYVRCGTAAYLAPISFERCTALQHVVRFGPPDDDWKGFLERAINKTLEDEDRMRIKRLQLLM